MAENLSFSRLRAVFVSYNPQIWGFGVIHWKCIYNFWCSMLVYCQLLYVLLVLLGVFTDFLPLTYWQDTKVPVPVFCCFWFHESWKINILRIGKGNYFTKFYTRRLQKPEGGTWGATGGPHPAQGLVPPSRAWGRCGPPPAPPFRLFIHPDGKTLDIAQKFQKEVCSHRNRRGEIRSSSRHPARGEIITGGLLHHHARLWSDVWVVHHRTTGPWQ